MTFGVRSATDGAQSHRLQHAAHVIHSLCRKPMALLLFPREAYRRTFGLLLERLPERQACRIMVEILAIAHERGCESELANQLSSVPKPGDCLT